MNVLQAIAYNSAVLKDAQRGDSDGAVAVSWLMHLVGDVHQPAHAVALFTRDMFAPGPQSREGDRGGNRVKFGPNKDDNLHGLWDDAPGANRRFRRLEQLQARADKLLAQHDLADAGNRARTTGGPAEWARESFTLADSKVYTPELRQQILRAEARGDDPDHDEIVDLPEDYASAAAAVADRRVVEGGFRLAATLDGLVR